MTDIKQDRSPRSPAIPLQDAIDQVAKLHKAIGKSTVPAATAASALEYKSLNGAALTALGTLSQYGLIERSESKVSVSPLTLSILYPSSEGAKTEALQRAALTSKVFLKIRKDFHDCDRDVLANQLIHERFTPDRAKIVAAVYKANSEFAKLDELRYDLTSDIDDNRNVKRGSERSESEKGTPLLVKAVKEETERSPALVKNIERAFDPNATSNVREFNVPLPTGGVISLKVPLPLSEGDWDAFRATLDTFKDGLVKRPEILCTDTDWLEKAKALAELGIEFNLLQFSYSHDVVEAQKLAKAHNFDLRLDPSKGVALFKKRQSEKKT